MIFLLPGTKEKKRRNQTVVLESSETNECISPCLLSTRRGGIRPGRVFEGDEKTTPKLADLSPILVHFSVIPFSPVTENRFIFNVVATLCFSVVRSLREPAGAVVKAPVDVPDWPSGPSISTRFPFRAVGSIRPLVAPQPTPPPPLVRVVLYSMLLKVTRNKFSHRVYCHIGTCMRYASVHAIFIRFSVRCNM